ncbi:hypothetical protein M5K25_004148 [Dendrobium thyrsiflorum]|uniref:fructokinase n=1 Tax=Dendrobium thyrsiflorum TaxID=117978 RepID=A0ABD0VMC6_DENTH
MDNSSLVVCFGEMLIDFVPTTNGLSLSEAPAFKKAPGGAPANVAVGIARLGGQSAFIGKVGEDEFGYMLVDILKKNNVNSQGMRFDSGARTALAFVTLRNDGEREFMFYRNPRADMLLEEGELDFDIIRKAKIFHYGSISLITEPCKSAHVAAAKAAKHAGVLLSYDPNLRLPLWPSAESAREGILSIWDAADIIKINEEEISFLTRGENPYDDAVVHKLFHPNLKLLLVTEGPNGCRYYSKMASGDQHKKGLIKNTFRRSKKASSPQFHSPDPCFSSPDVTQSTPFYPYYPPPPSYGGPPPYPYPYPPYVPPPPQPSTGEPSTPAAAQQATEGRMLIEPDGDTFHPSKQPTHKIRDIIRSRYDAPYLSWKKVPKDVRDMWFREFEKNFCWLPQHNDKIRKNFERRGSIRMRDMFTDIRKIGERPLWIGEGVWAELTTVWVSPDYNKRRDQNRQNRASDVGGLGSSLHIGGSVPHTEHIRRLKEMLGREPTSVELHSHTHKRQEDKQWVDERARAYEEYTLLRESQAVAGEGPSGGSVEISDYRT